MSKDDKKGKFDRVYLYGVSMGGHVVGHMIEKWRNSFAGALPVCGVMGDNELFDFFQDMYLVAETLVGNSPIVPTPADYYTNPAKGWQVTRTLLGTPYPSALTTTGTLFKQIIENLSGGDRPVYDQGFVGPSGGGFAFNFGSAVAGPGRENFDIVYQFDTNPAVSPQEQQFNNTVIRITASTQDRDRNGIFNQATSSHSQVQDPAADPAHARRASSCPFTWNRSMRAVPSRPEPMISWCSGRSAVERTANSCPPN